MIDEVVYGFQTIDSCRAAMIELAKKASAVEPPRVDSKPRSTKLLEVPTEEQARRIAADPAELEGHGYVALPLSLYEKLLRDRERRTT